MGLYAYATIIYGNDWLGEFELGKTSGTDTVLSHALYHIPSRGLPPEMPFFASYPPRLVDRVVDEFLANDNDDGRYVSRAKAEEDIEKGYCRWLGRKQEYVLYYPMSMSWFELKEMPELLVHLAENWWHLNRLTAIYELMKVLATDAHDGNARLVYWIT